MAIDRNTAAGSGTFSSTGAGTTLGPTYEGVDLNAGDRTIAFITSAATNPTITPPAGWTLIGSLYKPTTTLASAVYYRDHLVDDDVSAVNTWTWSAAGRMTSCLMAYSGCDLTVPPLMTSSNATVASSSFNTPAITLADGDWLISLVVARQNPGTADAVLDWTVNVPTDYESYQISTAVNGTNPRMATSFADSDQAMPAGSASRTLTNLRSMAEAHMHSVRLRAPLATTGWKMGLSIR